jgi:hypothetical protein
MAWESSSRGSTGTRTGKKKVDEEDAEMRKRKAIFGRPALQSR